MKLITGLVIFALLMGVTEINEIHVITNSQSRPQCCGV